METYFGNIELAQGDLARERVLTDLKTLARDMDALLKATAGNTSGKIRRARSHAAATLKRVKSVCNEVQVQAVTTAKTGPAMVDNLIRNHPYESFGAAFGLGLLIGVLTKRR